MSPILDDCPSGSGVSPSPGQEVQQQEQGRQKWLSELFNNEQVRALFDSYVEHRHLRKFKPPGTPRNLEDLARRINEITPNNHVIISEVRSLVQQHFGIKKRRTFGSSSRRNFNSSAPEAPRMAPAPQNPVTQPPPNLGPAMPFMQPIPRNAFSMSYAPRPTFLPVNQPMMNQPMVAPFMSAFNPWLRMPPPQPGYPLAPMIAVPGLLPEKVVTHCTGYSAKLEYNLLFTCDNDTFYVYTPNPALPPILACYVCRECNAPGRFAGSEFHVLAHKASCKGYSRIPFLQQQVIRYAQNLVQRQGADPVLAERCAKYMAEQLKLGPLNLPPLQ
uniref:TEA domain-containing protein n=1 Tax=Panagrellus redivivus TaxID=6233 RepID=A0A7E4VDZ1_PANRE